MHKIPTNPDLLLSDLEEWEKEKRVLYAAQVNRSKHKQLFVTLAGKYIVVLDGQDVMETLNPKMALDQYNDL